MQSTAALQAGADLALAAGAFEQKVTLVFSGEGLALSDNPSPGVTSHCIACWAHSPTMKLIRYMRWHHTVKRLPYRDDLTVLPMSQAEWTAAEAGLRYRGELLMVLHHLYGQRTNSKTA